MNKETIQHNNKKVIKTTKQSGEISYSIKGVYIGTDIKTGKRITKTITAKTLKALDRKIVGQLLKKLSKSVILRV